MGELVDADQEHLRLLRIGYFILAVISEVVAIFSVMPLSLGCLMACGVFPPHHSPGDEPPGLGWILLTFGVAFLLAGTVASALTWLATRSVEGRRHHTLCMVVAAMWCLYVPFGTVFGVLALLVLTRPSVKALFEPGPPGWPNGV